MKGSDLPAGALAPDRATGYAVRAVDLQTERETILGLWRGHVRVRPEAKYDWFYLGHPCGEQSLLLLTHGAMGEPAGVAGLGTRQVFIRGACRTAGMLADLVVSPEHRILFPAMLLQRQMWRTALASHGIVYGLPNRRSMPIIKRLGYSRVGDLVRYSKVLHHGVYLGRLSARWLGHAIGAVLDRLVFMYYMPYLALWKSCKGSWIDLVDERFDRLWQRALGFDGLIGTRDARFLSWRFMAQPGQQYRTYVIAAKGSADILAYAICEAEGQTLHVRDFLVDPARDENLRVLIHKLAIEAYDQGYSNLSLECLGPRRLHDSLTAAGLVERGKRPLYAAIDPQLQSLLGQLDWYMTCADEDQ